MTDHRDHERERETTIIQTERRGGGGMVALAVVIVLALVLLFLFRDSLFGGSTTNIDVPDEIKVDVNVPNTGS